MATLSTEQTADMERAIACLALELPAEVWEDVRDRWHAARDSMAAELERVKSEAFDQGFDVGMASRFPGCR